MIDILVKLVVVIVRTFVASVEVYSENQPFDFDIANAIFMPCSLVFMDVHDGVFTIVEISIHVGRNKIRILNGEIAVQYRSPKLFIAPLVMLVVTRDVIDELSKGRIGGRIEYCLKEIRPSRGRFIISYRVVGH